MPLVLRWGNKKGEQTPKAERPVRKLPWDCQVRGGGMASPFLPLLRGRIHGKDRSNEDCFFFAYYMPDIMLCTL